MTSFHRFVWLALLAIVWAVSGCSNTAGSGDETDVPGELALSDVSSLEAVGEGVSHDQTAGELSDDDDTAQPASLRLTVMSFNVLCFFCDDLNYDPWEERLDYFKDIFDRHQPDLVGLQELLFEDEVDAILERSPQYAALFFEDDNQALFKDYADATILYRSDRFEVVDNGYYWLSETPDVPLSGGWAEQNLARMVAWAHFRELTTGKELTFASTHFDNNTPNQEMSAPLFVNWVRGWASQRPTIVVGDFNSRPDSIAYGILTDPGEEGDLPLLNAFDRAAEWRQDSNQDPLPDYDPDSRIDHIFVPGEGVWTVEDWVVDLWKYGEQVRYPSDHRAIAATVELLD